MRKIIIAALAATSAFVAVPAFAQSASGTVTVSGTVAPKCSATAALDASIPLGELAIASGTVNSGFTNAGVGGLSRSFTVTCTSPNVQLSADASPLVNAAILTATAGYTNTVHYTATLTAQKAGSGSASAVDTSNSSGATTALLNGHLANSANNVTIAVSNGNTTVGSDLLQAGSYGGSIAIIVAPST